MSDVLIQAEGLGKKYLIGHQSQRESYSALRDVLARGAKTFFRKASDLAHGRAVIEGDELEEIWALRDVSFEVRRGDVLGIIGRNGAGKSTLLKILSRITEPTTGRVVLRGRVASLLEVGTGFHQELTGRENIFLNGAILGMSRAEIRRRFDEIVAFAQIEKFLDTPVKRYSSGMYVRLAFAVAAHLEPDILIVDEVLAVGDAEFQEKCLGKLRAVAAEGGRTVLFVSHNLAAIASLTKRAALLTSGRLEMLGGTTDVVKFYLDRARSAAENLQISGSGRHTRILSARIVGRQGEDLSIYTPGEDLCVTVDVMTDGAPGLSIELLLIDPNHQRLGISSLHQFHGQAIPTERGCFRYQVKLQGLWLAAGRYSMDIVTSVTNVAWDHVAERALTLEVLFSNPEGRGWDHRFDMGLGALALRSAEPPSFVPLPGRTA